MTSAGALPVMREMEEHAERDGIPIVDWEPAISCRLCRVLDPVVLEVDTAIGYSTLHMAEQLERGRVGPSSVTPSAPARRAPTSSARALPTASSWSRATRSRRSSRLEDPFDLLFVDASKGEYARYIELAEAKLSERALMVVDNL